MKHSSLHVRIGSRIFGIAVLAALVIAPAAIPVKAPAQEPAAASQQQAGAGKSESAATPQKPSEEEQEQAFLNAPVVHKIADLFHLPEPVARNILLLINFAIIFFAVVIPLGKMMPKVFRKRTQTIRFQLDEARKASEEAHQRMSAVETKLAGLDKEIAAFRTQAEQESLEDEKRIKASLAEESERIVASAEQEIDVAMAHARRSLQDFAADLAIENAARQLQLTPEMDQALINDFIEQVARENGGNGTAAPAGKGGTK